MQKADINDEKTSDIPLSLSLSPAGYLYLYADADTLETLPKAVAEKIHVNLTAKEERPQTEGRSP